MKKKLSIIAFCAVAFIALCSLSKTYTGTSARTTTSVDTLTSSGAGAKTNDTIYYVANYSLKGIGFQWDFNKISGTAGGYILVYGSENAGASYITTAMTTVNVTTATSQTVGYLPNSGSGNPYDHYMIVVVDTGTQVSSVVTTLLPRI